MKRRLVRDIMPQWELRWRDGIAEGCDRGAYDEGTMSRQVSWLPKGGGEILMDRAEEQLLKLAHRGPDGK